MHSLGEHRISIYSNYITGERLREYLERLRDDANATTLNLKVVSMNYGELEKLISIYNHDFFIKIISEIGDTTTWYTLDRVTLKNKKYSSLKFKLSKVRIL